MKKLDITPEERRKRILEQKKQEYQRHKERYQKHNKEYYLKNSEEMLRYAKEYRSKNRDELNKQHREYHHKMYKNPEFAKHVLERSRKWDMKNRKVCIEHYSYGKNCCELCGESDLDVLVIDHINGGGHQHRIKAKQHIIRDLIKNDFPEGFRVLCQNCNIREARRKGFFGTKRFSSIK